MVRYATAMNLGTADSEAILRRFTRANVAHPTYGALGERGKIVKTVFVRVPRTRATLPRGPRGVQRRRELERRLFAAARVRPRDSKMAITLCLEVHRETPIIGSIARQGVGLPLLSALQIIGDPAHARESCLGVGLGRQTPRTTVVPNDWRRRCTWRRCR